MIELNSKQRAYLRGLANPLDTTHQIGKDGFTENVKKDILSYLEAHELIKVRVLETAPDGVKELCALVAAELDASPVQVIGTRFVLYRQSSKPANRKIKL